MRAPISLIVLSLSLFAAACGGGTDKPPVTPGGSGGTTPSTGGGGTEPGAEPAIASVWRSKCGACHAKVEPNTRPREKIEAEMKKHKDQKRVPLSDEQWAQMTDFLAPAGGAAPAKPAG